MGVVALMSAKGSPGTTTSALLLAALWPAPVLLVDADVEGGDVALRLRREDGAPVDRERGLLSLLPLARRTVPPSALVEHSQRLRGGLDVVAGLTGPGQAGAAGHLWDNLADAVRRTADRDVLLDCGRVSASSPHLPLLQRADLVLCVVRPDVSGVVHARTRLAALAQVMTGPDGRAPRTGVLVVAERDRDAASAAAVLEHDLKGVDHVGTLVHDPVGAGVLAGYEVPRPERTLLVRSGRAVVEDVVSALRGERGLVPEPQQAQAAAPGRRGRRSAPRRRLFSREPKPVGSSS